MNTSLNSKCHIHSITEKHSPYNFMIGSYSSKVSIGSCSSRRNVLRTTEGMVMSPRASKSTFSPKLNLCCVCLNTAALAVRLNIPSVSKAGKEKQICTVAKILLVLRN